jgi:hypothetical protein
MGQEKIVRCGSDHFSRWLASYFLNIQQRLGLYLTPELKYLCQTAVITLFSSVFPGWKWMPKLDIFNANYLGFLLLPYFSTAYRPSSEVAEK